MSEAWTYAKAGIDLNKHREMHKIAHNIIEELSKKFGIEVYGLKSYTPYVKIGNFEICIHSDGVGTKSIIAENCCKEDVIGWDCVAMNVNDIVVDGFKPLLLSTYVALPEDNVEKFRKIMNGIEKACNYSKMILIGGETAIMPDLLNYVDISCFVLGLRIANPKEVNVNDIVIGIESSGVHANGYTLIRKIRENSDFDDIPIIIISTEDLEKTKAIGLKIGADIVLEKPIDEQMLINAVNLFLNF